MPASLSRRQFVIGGASSAVAAAAVAPGAARAGYYAEFSRESFEALIGKQVYLISQNTLTWHRATLVDVEDGPVSPGVDQFRIVLLDAARSGFEGGTCWFFGWADDGPSYFELYVQVGEDTDDGQYYSASAALLN